MVDRAKQLYLDKKKEFVIGNVYNLPLEDRSVDAVFSLGVWFHLKDLDKAHKEVGRVLKT